MILGIGGAGNNTISRLLESGLTGAECVAVNTDFRDLNYTTASRKILIGEGVTRGMSTNGSPEVGRAAMEQSKPHLESLLENIDVVFISAGLGGGTGTGAAPVVADIARRKGAVVVGMVTTPLADEASKIGHASQALREMLSVCDTVVVIDSSRIKEQKPELPTADVFKIADQILSNMIKGLVETLMTPSLVNLNFADFKTIVSKGGIAVVGVGESDASNRAEEAVRSALSSPLLDTDYTRAKGALIHISGDPNMTVDEANRVREIVTETIGHKALVSWGARVNPQNESRLKVTLVMTGVNAYYKSGGFADNMPKLYDLESSFLGPEKSLQIDLGLDQIENFED
jgi:cell division protein FtsZ